MVTLVVKYMVVDLFVDIVTVLVTNILDGVILNIDTSVDVVPSSISQPILVTGGTLEYLVLPWILI